MLVELEQDTGQISEEKWEMVGKGTESRCREQRENLSWDPSLCHALPLLDFFFTVWATNCITLYLLYHQKAWRGIKRRGLVVRIRSRFSVQADYHWWGVTWGSWQTEQANCLLPIIPDLPSAGADLINTEPAAEKPRRSQREMDTQTDKHETVMVH